MNSFSTIFTRFSAWTGIFAILVAGLISGCSSMDKPASASFASVVISNQSIEKIHQAADTVFANNGYTSIRNPDGTQVYEKEATRGDQIAYAGFVGAHEGEQTIVRVRMGIQKYGANAWLLNCNAWVITSPGSFVNEQSYALFGFQSKPYQRILDQIKGTLQNPVVTQ
jgi:hypothetical protein